MYVIICYDCYDGRLISIHDTEKEAKDFMAIKSLNNEYYKIEYWHLNCMYGRN